MMWPMHLDMSRDECKRVLRRFELEAYSTTVTALRAQGELSTKKRKLLQELASQLNISMERHKAEVRRAVNDEKLTTIAEYMGGPHTSTDWEVEGRRLIPLMPRLVPQTAFTALANNVANITAAENAKLPAPAITSKKEPAHDLPTPREPSVPEAARTPQERLSPTVTGTTVLPSGPSIQPKDEEENLKKRRRSLSIEGRPSSPSLPPPKMPPPPSHPQQPRRIVSYPMNMNMTPIKVTSCRPTITTQASSTQKVIIVSSPTNAGPPSILQRSLSVPIVKTVASTSSSNTLSQQRGSSLIMNNPSHSSSGVSNIVTISTNQGTTSNLTAKAVPIDGVHTSAYITSNNSLSKINPKPVLYPNKPRPRTSSIMIPMTRNQVPLPASGMQRATLRATRPHLQAVKQDITPVKLMPAAYTTTKILPKPSYSSASSDSPMYVMSTSTTTIPIQSRAVPANTTSRLITVNTSSAPKQAAKPVQTVHVSASSPGVKANADKNNLFLVHKSGSIGYSRGVPFAPGGKEALGKLVFGKNFTSASMSQPLTTVTVQKPSGSKTVQTTSNQHPIQLSGTTMPGNVLMIDLSKEQLSKNSVLAEILQASGIFGEGSTASECVDSSGIPTGPDAENKVTTEDVQLCVEDPHGELSGEVEIATSNEVVICEDPDSDAVDVSEDVAEGDEAGHPRIVTLEEAVALLGHSDSAETRALLRQAGIEVTDTVPTPDTSPSQRGLIDDSIHRVVHEEDVISAGHDSIMEVIGELDPQTGVYSIPSAETGSSNDDDQTMPLTQLDDTASSKCSNTVDIFSTALASADINLEAFQYMEEDGIDNQLISSSNTEGASKSLHLPTFSQSASEQKVVEPGAQQNLLQRNESSTKDNRKEHLAPPYLKPRNAKVHTAVMVEPSHMDTTEMHLEDFTSQKVLSYENV